MSGPKPGFSFSIKCDIGFAVGMATHDFSHIGTLVWIAAPIFDHKPSLSDVEGIEEWRWPIFFPLNSYLRRKVVDRIGVATVPIALEVIPKMRTNDLGEGWTLVEFDIDQQVTRGLGRATDPDVPIYQVVNDIALKQHIMSGTYPRDDW